MNKENERKRITKKHDFYYCEECGHPVPQYEVRKQWDGAVRHLSCDSRKVRIVQLTMQQYEATTPDPVEVARRGCWEKWELAHRALHDDNLSKANSLFFRDEYEDACSSD